MSAAAVPGGVPAWLLSRPSPKKRGGFEVDLLDETFKKCCKPWMQRGQLETVSSNFPMMEDPVEVESTFQISRTGILTLAGHVTCTWCFHARKQSNSSPMLRSGYGKTQSTVLNGMLYRSHASRTWVTSVDWQPNVHARTGNLSTQ